jgi:hypothetical protein
MRNSPGNSVTELWRRLQHSSNDSIRASVRTTSLSLTPEQRASLRARFGLQSPPAAEEERQLHEMALQLAIMKRRR